MATADWTIKAERGRVWKREVTEGETQRTEKESKLD